MFNPMTDVPKTDEEVIIALRRDDNITTKTLTDIYQCLREEGRSVRDAYEQTLLIHLSACEEAPI